MVRTADTAVLLGFPLYVVAFVTLGFSQAPKWVGAMALALFGVGTALLSAGVALPMLVRCHVCGLHLESSLAARKLSRSHCLSWMRSLNACPVCGDDGSATVESRERWRRSGLSPEVPYWSGRRIVLAILVTVLVAGGGYAIGALYRVGH
jgi:hypothetical protein